MQKTLTTISRFVFVGTILIVIMALFIVEILTINRTTNQKIVAQKNAGDSVGIMATIKNSLDENLEKIDGNVVLDDARPLLIRAYLEKYKSPLAPYSDIIFKLSETYGFEYYWIVAIAQQESNLCKKIPENSYNCWGYGINSAGTLKFDNYELALKSFAEYLKREYFDKGLNTPELIMKKYCPHSDGSWAYGVNQFIQEIETGKF